MVNPVSPASLGVSAEALANLTSNASKLGSALDQAFAKATTQGKNFDTTLKSVEKSLLTLLSRAASRQLEQSFSSLFSSSSVATNSTADATSLIPFATGGIVTTPTVLSGSGRGALTGEAGPEAIMPLQRGPDGTLGLRGTAPMTVHVTIQTQDLESFRRSEAQVAAAMTRALQRGRRAM